MDAEATERLKRDDIYADILARPLSEIVADICRDLGLSPDWSRLAQERWAKDEIESGKVGWPLAKAAAEKSEPFPHRGGGGPLEGASQAQYASASPVPDSS